MMSWLRRWRQRDDHHLRKRAAPLPADPIGDEAIHAVSQAQEREAEDERRLYPSLHGRHRQVTVER
jgi:hypothetical protein